MSTKSIAFEWLGTTEYSKALELQLEKSAQVRGQKRIHVFGLEHPAVVTFGKRAEVAADLPQGREILEAHGVSLVETDRGGQATLHSPGQLVIYPIVPLEAWRFGVRAYVQFLEEVTQAAFSKVGVFTETREGDPGVYTEQGKIAFCGIRVDRGVARHGMSLNIENDLELFQLIRPCGATSRPMDRLKNYSELTAAEFFVIWQESFLDLIDLRESDCRVANDQMGREEVCDVKGLVAAP